MEALVVWLICGIGAALIASNRGGGSGWFLIGVFLGPIGILLALTVGKRCPYCQSKMHEKATICPKCQKELPDSEAVDEEVQPAPESAELATESAGEPWPILMTIFLIAVVVVMIALFAEYR